MAVRERVRLPPSVFRLPVDRIREGYYSDAYFNLTKQLLEADDHHPRVLMQVFQRKDSLLGGVDEAIAVLKQGAGHYEGDRWVDGWEALDVRALHEGDEIAPWETVMTIEGDYSLFAHLETVYLGTMARRTLIMRNVREVVEASGGKPILYFPARHDHWLVQTGDGWAAQRAFTRNFGDQMHVTVLVDFTNDSVPTALEVAEALGPDLWGVRLDTSEDLVDRSLIGEMGGFKPTGVNARLVEKVRAGLDDRGFPDVRIVASGGFTAQRIREFETSGIPVDAYGVGSSLIRGDNDFTADIVLVDGQPCAKAGRKYLPNSRLERVA